MFQRFALKWWPHILLPFGCAFAGEASKQIHDYKFKLQKAEQDIATLEGMVSVSSPSCMFVLSYC